MDVSETDHEVERKVIGYIERDIVVVSVLSDWCLKTSWLSITHVRMSISIGTVHPRLCMTPYTSNLETSATFSTILTLNKLTAQSGSIPADIAPLACLRPYLTGSRFRPPRLSRGGGRDG